MADLNIDYLKNGYKVTTGKGKIYYIKYAGSGTQIVAALIDEDGFILNVNYDSRDKLLSWLINAQNIYTKDKETE